MDAERAMRKLWPRTAIGVEADEVRGRGGRWPWCDAGRRPAGRLLSMGRRGKAGTAAIQSALVVAHCRVEPVRGPLDELKSRSFCQCIGLCEVVWVRRGSHSSRWLMLRASWMRGAPPVCHLSSGDAARPRQLAGSRLRVFRSLWTASTQEASLTAQCCPV